LAIDSDEMIAAALALLRSGLTVREIAELLQAHPRAIEALIAI
jgi:DNA-binding CsgD family transcriptional regulator